MDELKWTQECVYISNVTAKRGMVREMNFSRSTFLGYCAMQRDKATREGHDDTAQYIQHCMDDLA